MSNKDTLDLALACIADHVDQLRAKPSQKDKDGQPLQYTATDATVLTNYVKLLSGLSDGEHEEDLTDEELLAKFEEIKKEQSQ